LSYENMEFISKELKDLKDQDLLRECSIIESAQGPVARIDGKAYILFCSNNYLDITNHPKIKQAAIDAINTYGCGTGASRLISGTMTIHQTLEKKIAEFKDTEAALLFPTGYMANLGAICSIVSKGDIVISDKHNHASIIDGCRWSGATLRVYPHNNINKLDSLLQRASAFRRKLIITESVFSMDGDIAPLPEIVEIARRYNALIMVDDAHATGVFGRHGKGMIEHCGLEGKVDIIMGSLSKAVGSIGGFIAGSRRLIDFLKNKARYFIYTTSLPPAVCAVSLGGLELIQEDTSFIDALWENIAYLRAQLSEYRNDIPGKSPIFPLIVGSKSKALILSEKLYQQGIFIPAIRPPTVPDNTSRLRISLMASHTKEHIDKLMNSLIKTGFFNHNTLIQ